MPGIPYVVNEDQGYLDIVPSEEDVSSEWLPLQRFLALNKVQYTKKYRFLQLKYFTTLILRLLWRFLNKFLKNLYRTNPGVLLRRDLPVFCSPLGHDSGSPRGDWGMDKWTDRNNRKGK